MSSSAGKGTDRRAYNVKRYDDRRKAIKWPSDKKKDEPLYYFAWGNNAKRATLKGRTCRVLARMKKNSIVIEFLDNGQREVVSRNSIRKLTVDTKAAS